MNIMRWIGMPLRFVIAIPLTLMLPLLLGSKELKFLWVDWVWRLDVD